MLANDGARVLSVDIDSTHVYERAAGDTCYSATPYPGRNPALATLVAEADIVVSAVPGEHFKVPTAHLRRGAVCIDLSEHGNFDADVRARAGVFAPRLGSVTILMLKMNALVLHCRARSGNVSMGTYMGPSEVLR
jgi:methylenetetrahydrofolate dehydrogenase (NAD+)